MGDPRRSGEGAAVLSGVKEFDLPSIVRNRVALATTCVAFNFRPIWAFADAPVVTRARTFIKNGVPWAMVRLPTE